MPSLENMFTERSLSSTAAINSRIKQFSLHVKKINTQMYTIINLQLLSLNYLCNLQINNPQEKIQIRQTNYIY